MHRNFLIHTYLLKFTKNSIHHPIDRSSTDTSAFANSKPIQIITSNGTNNITVENPPYVQLPIIKDVIEDLQGLGICESTSISATPVNWVMDRILGKL